MVKDLGKKLTAGEGEAASPPLSGGRCVGSGGRGLACWGLRCRERGSGEAVLGVPGILGVAGMDLGDDRKDHGSGEGP